jgi:hypothetical protein
MLENLLTHDEWMLLIGELHENVKDSEKKKGFSKIGDDVYNLIDSLGYFEPRKDQVLDTESFLDSNSISIIEYKNEEVASSPQLPEKKSDKVDKEGEIKSIKNKIGNEESPVFSANVSKSPTQNAPKSPPLKNTECPFPNRKFFSPLRSTALVNSTFHLQFHLFLAHYLTCCKFISLTLELFTIFIQLSPLYLILSHLPLLHKALSQFLFLENSDSTTPLFCHPLSFSSFNLFVSLVLKIFENVLTEEHLNFHIQRSSTNKHEIIKSNSGITLTTLFYSLGFSALFSQIISSVWKKFCIFDKSLILDNFSSDAIPNQSISLFNSSPSKFFGSTFPLLMSYFSNINSSSLFSEGNKISSLNGFLIPQISSFYSSILENILERVYSLILSNTFQDYEFVVEEEKLKESYFVFCKEMKKNRRKEIEVVKEEDLDEEDLSDTSSSSSESSPISFDSLKNDLHGSSSISLLNDFLEDSFSLSFEVLNINNNNNNFDIKEHDFVSYFSNLMNFSKNLKFEDLFDVFEDVEETERIFTALECVLTKNTDKVVKKEKGKHMNKTLNPNSSQTSNILASPFLLPIPSSSFSFLLSHNCDHLLQNLPSSVLPSSIYYSSSPNFISLSSLYISRRSIQEYTIYSFIIPLFFLCLRSLSRISILNSSDSLLSSNIDNNISNFLCFRIFKGEFLLLDKFTSSPLLHFTENDSQVQNSENGGDIILSPIRNTKSSLSLSFLFDNIYSSSINTKVSSILQSKFSVSRSFFSCLFIFSSSQYSSFILPPNISPKSPLLYLISILSYALWCILEKNFFSSISVLQEFLDSSTQNESQNVFHFVNFLHFLLNKLINFTPNPVVSSSVGSSSLLKSDVLNGFDFPLLLVNFFQPFSDLLVKLTTPSFSPIFNNNSQYIPFINLIATFLQKIGKYLFLQNDISIKKIDNNDDSNFNILDKVFLFLKNLNH